MLPLESNGFSVEDFRVYRVDEEPDGIEFGVVGDDIAFSFTNGENAVADGAQFIPCLDDFKKTTFDGEFDEDPVRAELIVSQTDPLTIAYYFVNGLGVCRVQSYRLLIDGVEEAAGVISDFQFGKYLVFDISGLAGNTVITLETKLISDPDGPSLCGNNAPRPGQNAHLSGVFISNCEPCQLEVIKKVEPDSVLCDSGTDGVDTGTDGDCICDCEDTGTDGDLNDDFECIAETVTYTYTVTNSGSVDLTDVTVMDDQLGLIAELPILGAGESETITVADVCLCEDTANKVTVTGILPNGTMCSAEDTASVTVDLECNDTGTDGF
jgi:hypothetical protein